MGAIEYAVCVFMGGMVAVGVFWCAIRSGERDDRP